MPIQAPVMALPIFDICHYFQSKAFYGAPAAAGICLTFYFWKVCFHHVAMAVQNQDRDHIPWVQPYALKLKSS